MTSRTVGYGARTHKQMQQEKINLSKGLPPTSTPKVEILEWDSLIRCGLCFSDLMTKFTIPQSEIHYVEQCIKVGSWHIGASTLLDMLKTMNLIDGFDDLADDLKTEI